VDSVIDDLAYTIGVSRIDLNVVSPQVFYSENKAGQGRHLQEAAAKGLIAGSFCLIRESDVLLDARSASEVGFIVQV
jgi:hypothetical protein